MLRATLNEAVPLQLQLTDKATNLFPQVKLYNTSGTLLSTINLTHVTEGLYRSSYTPTAVGYIASIYSIYSDALHTTLANYTIQLETIEVSSDKTSIAGISTDLARVRGLLHENAVYDQQTYDDSGHLLSGRIRVYSSATAAATQDISNLLFEYTLTASYTQGKLISYKIIRVI